MHKLWIILGAVNGFMSVALGAFAAHGLKGKIDDSALESVITSARYQMYAALTLVLIGLLTLHAVNRWLTYAGVCFTLGAVFFSGSLYLMAMTQIKGLGIITPVGGLLFLVGWVLVGVSAFKVG